MTGKEHLVYKCRFAMVDMRDYRDISYILHTFVCFSLQNYKKIPYFML